MGVALTIQQFTGKLSELRVSFLLYNYITYRRIFWQSTSNFYFPEPIKLPSSSPILNTPLKSVAIPTMDLAVSGTCISHECTCIHSTRSILGSSRMTFFVYNLWIFP